MPPRSVIAAFVTAVLALGSAPVAFASTAHAAYVPGVPGFDIGAGTKVDWTGVKAAGAEFVFIQATEGTSYTNPNLPVQSSGAYGAGLVRGAAHFATPNTSGGAVQADYFVAHGGAWSEDHQTLPGALDIEYNPYGATCYGLGQSAMSRWITDFVNQYRARTGRWAIIYTTASWWNQCVGTGSPGARDPLWIAGYNGSATLPAGWSAYAFWQYATAGAFPGGQDVFDGTPDDLVALADGTS